MKILAIDLGGMSSKIGLLHGEKIIKRWNIKTDLNNIFQNIKDNLKGLKDEDYDEVSFATPGFLNPEKGIIKPVSIENLFDELVNYQVLKEIEDKKYITAGHLRVDFGNLKRGDYVEVYEMDVPFISEKTFVLKRDNVTAIVPSFEKIKEIVDLIS